LELVDVREELPGLETRPGLSTWKVLGPTAVTVDNHTTWEDEKLTDHTTWDNLSNAVRGIIHRSMFPPTPEEQAQFHLDRCLRLFPHCQDTGGFFIAVIKKVAETENIGQESYPIVEDLPEHFVVTPEDVDEKKHRKTKKGVRGYSKELSEEPFEIISGSTLSSVCVRVRAFFGIPDTFPLETLFTRSSQATKLYFANPAIRQFIYNKTSPDQLNLRIINCGIRIFSNDNKKNKKIAASLACEWRIMREGLIYLLPYITKQIIHMTYPNFLLLLKADEPLYFGKFNDPDIQAILEKTEMGSVVLCVTVPTDKDNFPGLISLAGAARHH